MDENQSIETTSFGLVRSNLTTLVYLSPSLVVQQLFATFVPQA